MQRHWDVVTEQVALGTGLPQLLLSHSEAQNAGVAKGLRSGRPPPSPCLAEEPKRCGMNAEMWNEC